MAKGQITVSMDDDSWAQLAELEATGDYENRSQVIRHAIAALLAGRTRWRDSQPVANFATLHDVLITYPDGHTETRP